MLQESFVLAIERAASALRIVHDDSQSRELRCLIAIRWLPSLQVEARSVYALTTGWRY